MTIIGKPKTPWHLWVVGVISLLWNMGGAISYTMTKLGRLDEFGMPAELQGYFYDFPAWASAFWALGVWGCLAGSVALLMRSRFAVSLYAISIIGLLGTTLYEQLFSDLPEALQTTGQTLFAVAIWVITTGLLLYSSRMKRAGILR